MKELQELLGLILEQLLNGMKRIDAEAEWEGRTFEISGYQVGNIYRMDIKPK